MFVLQSISSPDALDDVLTAIGGVLAPKASDEQPPTSSTVYISRESKFGLFIRRLMVSYNKLLFEGLSQLYDNMKSFMAEYEEKQHQNQHESSRNSLPSFDASTILNVSTAEDNGGMRSAIYVGKINLFLEQKAQLIERGMDPVSMAETERQLQALPPNIPKVHFVRYLNFKSHREFQKALDSLHQYHDYSLNAHASREEDIASHALIQYAVLNLAALHFEFEHYGSAMTSIQEAIRLAQQHGDHVCVAFAITWLMRLYDITKDSRTALLIQDCLRRSQRLKLSVVHTFGTLSLVERQLFGETMCAHAIEVWKTLQDTLGNLMLNLSLTPLTNIPSPGMVAGANAAAKGNLESDHDNKLILQCRSNALESISRLHGKGTMMKACTWQLFGHRSLEEIYTRIHLKQYTTISNGFWCRFLRATCFCFCTSQAKLNLP